MLPVEDISQVRPPSPQTEEDHEPLMLLALNSTAAVEWDELQTKVRFFFFIVSIRPLLDRRAGNSCRRSFGKAPQQVQRVPCGPQTCRACVGDDVSPSSGIKSRSLEIPLFFRL